jgi:tRNA dimethylallyltransferase
MVVSNLGDKLVVLVGQTASGKSALAMELAQKFNGEIICADSRTVYKGMDIGTAKPSTEDRQLVRHHLVDVVDPDERFTAADFKQLANSAIEDILARGKLPIMVGGTGLYIDGVLYDFSFPGAGAPRDPQNPRHVAKDTGSRKPLRDNTLVIGLKVDKDVLKKRIEKRVEQMTEDGFIEEVRSLMEHYEDSNSAFSAPGYRPFIEYLKGKMTLDTAKQKFVQNDLNLAKRQKTWFKRNPDIHWIDKPEQAFGAVQKALHKIQ